MTQPGDLDEIEGMLALLGREIPRHKVLLMPEGITREAIGRRAPWLSELCKSRGYRYAHRLHIELYGNKRGDVAGSAFRLFLKRSVGAQPPLQPGLPRLATERQINPPAATATMTRAALVWKVAFMAEIFRKLRGDKWARVANAGFNPSPTPGRFDRR